MLNRLPARPPAPLGRALALLLAALAGACTGSSGASGVSGPVTEAIGITTPAVEPKDFVRQSRTSDPAYLAVGVSVKRDAPRKTVDEFKALESSLDAVRGSNEAAGSRAKTLGATPPPKPPPKPSPLPAPL